ncbi:MAG: GNAT family N-acetyltransferase [Acidimicrobiales bacterium]
MRLAALDADPTAFGQTHAEEAASGEDHWGEDHWIERAAGSEIGQTFVAVLNNEFVGVCGAHLPTLGGPVELVSVWTAPATWGHGVGRSLVETVLEWATRS